MDEENPKYNDQEIQIRDATKDDMEAVAEMTQELANYQNMPDGPKLSVQELQCAGFDQKAFRCKIAELTNKSAPKQVVGYAMYFPTYSSWEGRSVMLQDLYVRSSERRRGIGERLFNAVAKEASSTGCSRLDFYVLEWNPARKFYEGKGAVNMTKSEQACVYRLRGQALHNAAMEAEDEA
ncbi:hypothetical protein ABMA27_011382 [Loxostege sticticalis]|uniref:N-acetyltransferase domain-containing protein n=1 Tax=Loxostege sticticalis TaxID=481309 RepID=A0ABR3IG23_LOXSC